jgi:hypothetical protein
MKKRKAAEIAKAMAPVKCLGLPTDTKFRQVAMGHGYAIAYKDGIGKPAAWGDIISRGLLVPPKAPWEVGMEPSCASWDDILQGPASCTKCREGCHHTVTSPKTNAGTCSKAECPTCKPKACCGAHHKHYVVNTESLLGVCVRHNDDCTAVCVPGIEDRTKRRVCSKGCNRILKVPKPDAPKDAIDEALTNDIVVCQVDHRLVCEPWSRTNSSACHTSKEVAPVARCDGFQADVWGAGATCIANLAHNNTHVQCGETRPALRDEIKAQCRAVDASDAESQSACTTFALALAEYY